MKYRILFFTLVLFCGIFFSFSSFNQKILTLACSFFAINLNREFWNFGLQHFGTELLVLSGILIFSFFIRGYPGKILFYIAAVVLLFFVFLFQNTVNIPITDDYAVILDFSNNYFFSETVSEKFSLLVSFYDESRIIIIRVAVIILHFVTGEVNMKTLILFSNLSLPLILFLFYKSMPPEELRWEYTLIIAVLLFHFAYYDAIVWAMPAIHYKLIIVCLMPALFFIRKKAIGWQAAACVSAVISGLTTGNGLLVFPVIILYFFIEKKWRLFSFWLISAIVLSLIYFRGFPAFKSEVAYFSIVAHFSVTDYFIFSCCFLGSAFQFFYKLHLPFISGLIIWIFFIILTFKKYFKTNFLIYGLILFVMLSSLVAAHFRLDANGFGGLNGAIANRYGFYSLIAFSASLIAFSEIIRVKKKFFIPLFLSLGIIYHLLSGIFFFPEVPVRKQKLEKFISDIKNSQPFVPIAPIIPEGAGKIVQESIEKEIYFP